MRKYAYLKEPFHLDDGGTVYKIMYYATPGEIYLFEYDSPDAVLCSADLYYDSLDDLKEEWNGLIDRRGWIDLGDPLPGCQHDAFLPLRVKGRNTGNPQWGTYEILKDGAWVEYKTAKENVQE